MCAHIHVHTTQWHAQHHFHNEKETLIQYKGSKKCSLKISCRQLICDANISLCNSLMTSWVPRISFRMTVTQLDLHHKEATVIMTFITTKCINQSVTISLAIILCYSTSMAFYTASTTNLVMHNSSTHTHTHIDKTWTWFSTAVGTASKLWQPGLFT